MKRVSDPADPRRCRGNRRDGQCSNEALPGSEYCAICGGSVDRTDELERRQYLLTKAQYRKGLNKFAEHEDLKSLRDEIAIARMLIEERLNTIDSQGDLLAACGPLNQLLLTVERLVKSAHVLEQNIGELMSRDAVMRLGNKLSSIVVEVLKEEQIEHCDDIADEIFSRFALCVKETRNEEPVRAVKLISNQ